MNRELKDVMIGISAVIIPIALAIGYNVSHADTGHEGATRKEIGSYADVRRVTGSSVAGTEFFSASIKRPDGSIVNNTASTIWIGTMSATQHNTMHDNIRSGYPVTSTQPFKLDGSMTGNLYFTCDVGVASCEVRAIDGLVR